MQIHILCGAPGSGKSTFASDLQHGYSRVMDYHNYEDYDKKDYPLNEENCVIVSRDIIRFDLFKTYKTNKTQEKEVKLYRNYLIDSALARGQHVIIDDTNLSTLEYYRNTYSKEHELIIHWMEDSLDLQLCQKRNANRDRSVPPNLVESMYYQFCKLYYTEKMKFPYPVNSKDMPKCILLDIDGTTGDMTGVRGAYEWNKVDQDAYKEPACSVIESYIKSKNYKVIFVSGRDSVCEVKTRFWLSHRFGLNFTLYMRPENDTRKDRLVKSEIYFDKIFGKYTVDCVFDDRDSVCSLWAGLGLNVFQVRSNGKSNWF